MEELVWKAEIVDKATETLKNISGEAEKADDAIEEMGDASKKAGVDLDGMGAAAGKAAAGIGLVAAGVAKAVQAYSEQEQVDRQLKFAIDGITASQEEANAVFARANELFARNQDIGLFGDEDQSRALRTLIRTTQDYEQSLYLLNTSLDVATASGKGLEEVTKTIAEGATGNVAPLVALGLVTQEQVTHLNKLSDAGERWAKTLEIVEAKTKGARAEAGDTAQSIAQLGNDAGDVEQSFGKLFLVLGEGTTKMATFHDETKRGQSAMSAYAADVSEFADELAVVFTNLSAGEIATEVLSPVREVNGELETQVSIFGKLSSLVDKAYDKQALEEFEEGAKDITAEVTRTKQEFSFLHDEIVKAAGPLDALGLAINANEEDLAKWRREQAALAKKAADERRKELEATEALLDAIADAATEAERAAELEARRELIAQLRLQNVTSTSELQQSELERTTALVQLQHQIADGEVTRTEAALRRAEIEQSAIARTMAMERRRADAEAKQAAEALAARQKLHALSIASTQQGIADAKALGGTLVGAFQAAQAPAALLDVLRGGFLAAEAVGLAAINPVGAIQAGVGAAMHFANAAKFGAGGGSAGGGGGGSTGGGIAPPAEDAKRVATEAFVEAFQRVNSGGQSERVVYDFSGATFVGRDQASARDLADLLAGNTRLVLGDS